MLAARVVRRDRRECQLAGRFQRAQPRDPVVVSSVTPASPAATSGRCSTIRAVSRCRRRPRFPDACRRPRAGVRLELRRRGASPRMHLDPRATSAAQIASWVEPGFDPEATTCAPASARSVARYAVFASRWTTTATLAREAFRRRAARAQAGLARGVLRHPADPLLTLRERRIGDVRTRFGAHASDRVRQGRDGSWPRHVRQRRRALTTTCASGQNVRRAAHASEPTHSSARDVTGCHAARDMTG